MGNSISNIVTGKPLVTGGVWRAPAGTDLPTDAITALGAEFTAAGYIGEDGLTESAERSTDKVKAWGGDTIAVVQSDYSVTYAFTFAEALGEEALRATYGEGNVSGTGGSYTVKLNKDQLEHCVWVFEIKDGNKRIRICVEDGQVTETGEVTYNDGGIVSYPVTIEAFANADGDCAVKYLSTVSGS